MENMCETEGEHVEMEAYVMDFMVSEFSCFFWDEFDHTVFASVY